MALSGAGKKALRLAAASASHGGTLRC